MPTSQERIKAVLHFFDNQDLVLGYRKFMDCAMDTQNMSIYNDVIQLTDWKETYPDKQTKLIEKAKIILEKIAQIDILESDVESPIIIANDIIKSYGTNRFELGPITLAIKKRQVYGLVGENGNGKTTLLRILAKELNYNSGQLQFNFDTTYYSTYNLRTHLVYIPQRTKKWHGSLKDNLKFVLSNYDIPPAENETRVLMMIARFGLWNYKHLKWSELSSGYKMRFELARTMLRQPQILLLDEPLANLDVLAQQVILEDLKSICNSINNPVALILSSQQLYEVEKISDKVIYLKNGKYKEKNDGIVHNHSSPLIVEIDCECERDRLTSIFEPLSLEKLQFNGGVFVAFFPEHIVFSSVLETLGKCDIQVTYIRNISKSTRRFFVS